MERRIEIEKQVLSENDKVALQLRQEFADRRVLALNLVSSPGSGKTSLLVQTLSALKAEFGIAVVAGDVQTENDAQRLRETGGGQIRAIETRGACHLDALMMEKALVEIDLDDIDILFIENVGNLVCPSSYDLGEEMKVVIISTTEGDDKPLKYPGMFRRSSLMITNKIDMIEMCDFDLEKVRSNAVTVNNSLEFINVSCRTGEGLDLWYDWLRKQVASKKATVCDKSG